MRKESMLEVRKDSKSILAKLLATENITVEHGKFNTASFDVKNRVLRLPILKEMSGDIYDLMVLHEVGHALWTPEEGWHGKVSSMGKGFKSYLNVVEDARIEKKIKNRYPGGRRSFLNGYKDLVDRDFFGTKGRDLNELGLIDRINLYTKGGTSMGIDFIDEEISFVDKIESLETFEDAMRVAEELYNYAKENESETDNHEDYSAGGFDDFDDEDSDDFEDSDSESNDMPMPDMPSDEFGEENDEDGMESSADGGSGEDDSEGEDGADSSEEDSGSNDKEKSEKTKESAGAGSEGGVDGDFDPESETDNSWRENEKELVSESAKEYLYLNIPKFKLDELIVSYKDINNLCVEHYNKEEVSYGDASEGNFEWGTKKFNEFRTENKKIVEYLAKEFEMKKAASEYSRAATANSGIIDSERLHTYKFNDQLFKKISVIPDGKNHGLVMLVDWSGSMSANMKGTIEQMICLVMFCKRVNIPFEVYAFSDSWYGHKPDDYGEEGSPICSAEVNELKVGHFRLLNLFSSKMKANDLRNAYIYMTVMANAFAGRYGFNYDIPRTIPSGLSLGGTPLDPSLLSLFDVIPAFKKSSRAEIVNVIFLTDGDSNSLSRYWKMVPVRDEDTGEDTDEFTKDTAHFDARDKNVIMRDRISKKEWNLSNKVRRGEMTQKLVEALKERFGINIVNFFLIKKMDRWTLMKYFDDAGCEEVSALQKEWRKNKYLISKNTAWSELYVIQGGKEFETNRQELTVGADATNAQLRTAFRKFTRGKLENRKMLSSFVEKVAA